jgi:hypothetical protein
MRRLSSRWRTANRGVNNLASIRIMLKINGFVMGGVQVPHESACMVLFKAYGKCYGWNAFVEGK